MIMKICPKCSKEYDTANKFCSRSCANSRIQTVDMNNARRSKLKGLKGPTCKFKGLHLIKRETRICKDTNCNKIFECKVNSERTYCCEECRKRNSGGYRDGSGRAKSGYYKGIYCGSTYELAWVIYNIDHNIEFKRFETTLIDPDSKLKYVPDFIQGNCIIEMKGFEEREKVEAKSNLAKKLGYQIKVLYKDDLQYAFDYVSSKYGSNKFYTLYDKYKPKFDYVCNTCGINFSKDIKKVTDKVFCSRQCACKFNQTVCWSNR